jgi:hypothetical protein
VDAEGQACCAYSFTFFRHGPGLPALRGYPRDVAGDGMGGREWGGEGLRTQPSPFVASVFVALRRDKTAGRQDPPSPRLWRTGDGEREGILAELWGRNRRETGLRRRPLAAWRCPRRPNARGGRAFTPRPRPTVPLAHSWRSAGVAGPHRWDCADRIPNSPRSLPVRSTAGKKQLGSP